MRCAAPTRVTSCTPSRSRSVSWQAERCAGGVRWRQGERYRSQTFDRKGDAVTFAAEIRRRQQLGTLVSIDRGRETLLDYVTKTWAPAYGSNLARKTQLHYEHLLVKHVLPELGPLELRAITPEMIARWQADRVAAGYGRVSIRHAFDLLGSILQRALEGGQIQANPTRAVRKAPRPRHAEVRPLSPAAIERMRAASAMRHSSASSPMPACDRAKRWRWIVRDQPLGWSWRHMVPMTDGSYQIPRRPLDDERTGEHSVA